jgi:2-polyprenyl-3-methyl-5-hydroxy-6-metoxy-1,4-benzoquinol methylase
MSEVEHWEERYRTGNTPWQMAKPSGELVRVVTGDGITPCAAIDLGCGLGTHSIWLAQQGFEVTGVDISPLAIECARERAAAAGVRVRFLAADLLDPPDLGGPYGFFFDRGCYHIVRSIDVRRYLQTLEKITQPGSVGLVLTGNANEPRTGPPVVAEEEIRRELGGLFEIVRLREFRFDPSDSEPGRPLGWSCLLRRR